MQKQPTDHTKMRKIISLSEEAVYPKRNQQSATIAFFILFVL
jgi:hypothetical protein